MKTAVSNRNGSFSFQSEIDALTRRIFPVDRRTRMPNANESVKIDLEAHEPEISVGGMSSTFDIVRSALLFRPLLHLRKTIRDEVGTSRHLGKSESDK
ncbi:hypothetical protein CEXT_279561 [Caerostris extrusa]|uniref:Uncharacterized protein n=1 Tax=Caerostris extrusa TaxID=172846 RepID=A0AAV4X0S2_CAEEX|nr:hypothetical protein CEXT_279561 [Caerostris extrusa]